MSLSRIALLSGRSVELTELRMSSTYGGMLEGYPCKPINDMKVGSLQRQAERAFPSTPVHLVPPAVATAGQEKVNPHALPLDGFATEAMGLLAQDPTPREILVKGVLMHCFAERDGTYDDLVAQRSQALSMLPGRRG